MATNVIVFLIVVIVVIFKKVEGEGETRSLPQNPCPAIFAYRSADNGDYYGEVRIPYDGNPILNLQVNVSMAGMFRTSKLRLEMVTPTDLVRKSRTITYKVVFPSQSVLPKITQILYNGQVFCSGPPETLDSLGVTDLWASYTKTFVQTRLPANPINTSPNLPANPINTIPESASPITLPENAPANRAETCGLENNAQQLILKGEQTKSNEFPWLVAIYHNQRSKRGYKFHCTATLISTDHVITAAHCLKFYKADLIPIDEILLALGSNNLEQWSSRGVSLRTAIKVLAHPDYKQGTGHCDVAIVRMNEAIVIKINILPICLDDDVSAPTGTIAGWGATSSDGPRSEATATKATLDVVSNDECTGNDVKNLGLVSGSTFCGKTSNGSSPCFGDTGAGFMVKRDDRRWFLRGVVSLGINRSRGKSGSRAVSTSGCERKDFIVFADLAKMEGWIKESLRVL